VELREIIRVDGLYCVGCGVCIETCPHEALQFVEGQSRLVGDAYCEACGNCVSSCSNGALSMVSRHAAPFDEAATAKRLALRERVRKLAEEGA
jgi:ferredoxin